MNLEERSINTKRKKEDQEFIWGKDFDFKRLKSLTYEQQSDFIEKYFVPNKYILKNKDILELDEDTKILILNKSIEKIPFGVSDVIDQFNIKDQNVLERMAMTIIKKNPSACINIEKFNIESEKARIEIANHLLKKDYLELADSMHRFNIQDKSERVKMVKAIAKMDATVISVFWDNFKIVDKGAIVDILKIAAAQNGDSVSCFIRRYNIVNESDRIDIAKIAAKQDGNGVARYIKNYKLTNQKALVEIAKIVAKDDLGDISRYIKDFDIKDEMEKIEIAKIAAKQNGGKVTGFIENYGISDTKILFNLLKEVAISDEWGLMTAKKIESYGVKSLKDLNYIFNILIMKKSTDNEVLRKLEIYVDKIKHEPYLSGNKYKNKIIGNLPGWITYIIKTINGRIFNRSNTNIDNIQKIYELEKNIKKLHKFYQLKKNYIAFNMKKMLGKDNANKINKILNELKDDFVKDKVINFIHKPLFLYSNNMEVVKSNRDLMTRLLIELINVRNTELKQDILPFIAELINDNKVAVIEEEIKHNNKTKALTCMYSVIFNKFGLYSEENKERLDQIRSIIFSNRIVKDANATQNIITKLMKLERTHLTMQQKSNILDYLFKDLKSVNDNCKYLNSIILFNEIESITHITKDSDRNELKDRVFGIYGEILNLEGRGYKFVNKYLNFMEKTETRNFEELFIYYISEHKNKSDMMETIGKFVDVMVDQKSFATARYNVENSEHLKKISEKNTEIFKKWTDTKGFTGLKGNRARVTDDVVDLFLIGTEVDGSCQSIVGDSGENNKCLMGYVVDGKNKAIVVKEPKTGRIQARSILRLLIDEKTKEPVLVEEKVYSIANKEIYNKCCVKLEEQSIEYAKWLDVSLVKKVDREMKDEKKLKDYKNNLISIDGCAPYEYVDSANSYFINGKYTVGKNNLKYVYERVEGPSKK